MRIAVILGTRPEIIKLSPVIRACESRCLDYFLLHTGQHYSKALNSELFSELGLVTPQYSLDAGSGSQAEQTARMLVGIEQRLRSERPRVALVQGDTNTVLAATLAAKQSGIRVGHVEAGLRSYDRSMPEEINRTIADHIGDQLFAPTQGAADNLLKEGISATRIFMTGNTIVDAVRHHLRIAGRNGNILDALRLKHKEYLVVTAHRPENVDVREKLAGILNGIDRVRRKYRLPVICPVHPRTKERIDEFKLNLPEGILAIEPVGHLDFLQLEAHAALLLTDSGGVQEEGCILRVPCVTMRDNTERPETLAAGSNALAGADPERILTQVDRMMQQSGDWENPFGDGNAAARILDTVLRSD